MELRLYCFVNYYLSSIQQGVQTGHAAVDLVRKYTACGNPLNEEISPEKQEMVDNWADFWKTFIILNGGNAEGIKNATDIIARNGAFPWAIFAEDQQSLSGIQTCVAVILPESIFKAVPSYSGDSFIYEHVNENGTIDYAEIYKHDHRNFELIELIKGARLAT